MKPETVEALSFGATVVGSLFLFAAFVALFRHDLGDPRVAATVFASLGGVILLAGRLLRRLG